MTERTTYDLFVKGDKYLNFDTEKGAREWLKGARAEGRLVSVDVDVRPRKSREYRIGEMWRDDFDYEGMVKAGSKADITWGPKTLRKLFDSFEDVNYHGPSSPLWSACEYLEKGERAKAERELDIFRKVCKKMEDTKWEWYPKSLEDIEKEFGKMKNENPTSIEHLSSKTDPRRVRGAVRVKSHTRKTPKRR